MHGTVRADSLLFITFCTQLLVDLLRHHFEAMQVSAYRRAAKPISFLPNKFDNCCQVGCVDVSSSPGGPCELGDGVVYYAGTTIPNLADETESIPKLRHFQMTLLLLTISVRPHQGGSPAMVEI